MAKTVVITGINGFVGKHLTRDLADNGYQVIGIGFDDIHPEIKDLVSDYIQTDLSKGWPDIKNADAIIHLAGLAAVGPSFDRPQDYISINSSIMTHMCEYYLRQLNKPRIVAISSGAIYDHRQALLITETSPVIFTSPYSVSKVLLENQAAYYHSRGLECVVMRPFNHIGPGQAPGFLVPDLAEKIIVRKTPTSPISVGNLDTKRDYTDVRDVVCAYRLVATSSNAPRELIYNVCSGESHDGKEILDLIVNSMDIQKPEVIVDESLIRPNDILDIRGDNSRLREEFGWSPSFEITRTIDDFVRARLDEVEED